MGNCFCGPDYKEVAKKKENKEIDFEGRKCRDVFWLLFFGVFLIGMMLIMGFAYGRGDYRRITNGMDYRGCICGTTSKWDAATNQCDTGASKTDNTSLTLGKKSVFVRFTNTSRFGAAPVIICAETCPAATQLVCVNNAMRPSGVEMPAGASLAEQIKTILADHQNEKDTYVSDYCGVTVAAKSAFGYCVPTQNNTFVEAAQAALDSNQWAQAFSSMQKAGWVILLCLLFSIGFSFFYLKALQVAARLVTLIAMVSIFFAFIFAAWTLMGYSNEYKEAYTGENAEGYKDNTNWQMAFYGAVVFFILAILYVLLACFMFKRVMLAVTCINLASQTIIDSPTVVMLPFVMVVAGVGIAGWWTTTTVYLFSAGEIEAADPPSDLVPNGVYKKLVLDDSLQGAFVYHLFGLFWVIQFGVAFLELTIAYVTARWYFADVKDGERELPASPLKTAISYVCKYHLGSVAMGSLLVAIIQMIRAAVEYLDMQRRKMDPNNKVVQIACCCVKCCLWCMEKCMRFINRQAYIQIAITGASFCEACKRAFGLVARNLARVGALKVVATLFIVLGKLLIGGASALLCFMILTNVKSYSDLDRDTAVPNPFIPSMFTFCVTYAIGSMFMGVYGTAIDSVLMCFIQDCEVNGEPKHAGQDMSKDIDALAAKSKKEGIKHPSENDAETDVTDSASRV